MQVQRNANMFFTQVRKRGHKQGLKEGISLQLLAHKGGQLLIHTIQ